MVRLGCVPEQGGPSAYMENAKAVRTAAPGRQEQTDDLGKNGPETTAVRSNDSACRDQAVWSWTEGADDWREQAVRMLEQLKKQYPGIVFHLAQEKDAGDLAAQAGTGVHLYLSREFVGRMGSSREDFSQCWSELVSAAGTLLAKQGQTRAVGAFLGEDGTSYWSVQDKTEKEAVPVVSHTGAQETPSAGSDPRVRVSVSLNVSSHFSRVARARTKGQVQEAVWDIYRSISNLKRAAACGDDQQRVKASRALRSLQKLLGRSGRKNPRLGEDFIKWADEESILKIITNTYDYVREYIDKDAPGGKEHIGYIVDRTGFEEFKRWALKDVKLPDMAEVNERIYWSGVKY